MVIHHFGISETSEKTVEINILTDVSNMLQDSLKRPVSIIAPSQNQEDRLGFDEFMADLPFGITIVFQFKKPYSYKSGALSNFSKFSLSTSQLITLARNFRSQQAFYVFLPLPRTLEIITYRRRLLEIASVGNVHQIPNVFKNIQKTRTVRMERFASPPNIEIADPRIFEKLPATSMKKWCVSFTNFLKEKKFDHREEYENKKFPKFKGLYYIHIDYSKKYPNPFKKS